MDLDPRDKAEIQRIRRKVDSIAGPGVRHTRETIHIGAPPAEHATRRPSRPELFRMIVTQPDVGPSVVLAKFYDGSAAAGSAIPVRVYWQREVDDELYAFIPAGGTDSVYDGSPVIWLEMYTLGQPQFQGMSVVAATQNQVAWDFQRAYVMPEEA